VLRCDADARHLLGLEQQVRALVHQQPRGGVAGKLDDGPPRQLVGRHTQDKQWRHTDEAGVRRRPDGRIEAWVRDNGPGIPADMLPRIFEPFFTTKAPGSGTGLGLPVVKQLVESWGGNIQVESSPGSGTRIVLDLPAARSS
jgi:signal transduction histidine kinase